MRARSRERSSGRTRTVRSRPRVGLGIVTCSRELYLRQALKAIEEHLGESIDVLALHSDDGIFRYPPHMRGIEIRASKSDFRGVAHSKNAVLSHLLGLGCEWLIVSEDDVVVKSPLAVDGYISACKSSGLSHLAFAHHGPANQGTSPVELAQDVLGWPNFVGAWSIYSREALEVGGVFDENFVNAWEHVEHTLRLGLLGYTCSGRLAADAKGSQDWIEEIPGSIDNSSIRPRSDWQENIERGREYWLRTKPETARLIWPEG